MNLETPITKADVIATVCFVAGAYLLYKTVKEIIEDRKVVRRVQRRS